MDLTPVAILVDSCTFEQFIEERGPERVGEFENVPTIDRTLLFLSVQNKSPVDRVKISLSLLDAGCDASVVSGGINVLHVLFAGVAARYRGFEVEAPLVAALLAGGASMNVRDRHGIAPLECLIDYLPGSMEEADPFWDVIFAHPGIDLDAPVGSNLTVRQMLSNIDYLRERGRRYEAEGLHLLPEPGRE